MCLVSSLRMEANSPVCSWLVDRPDDRRGCLAALAGLLQLIEDQLRHQPDRAARGPVLARLLVVLLVEAADQFLEVPMPWLSRPG